MPLTFLKPSLIDDDGSNDQPIEPRVQVMLIILVISFFAVSFPGASRSISFLRIPHIVFFIGKHFGTGVILATAFIHLLQDSFEALQKRQVKEHYNGVGKYTGLIILASLLTIFLIEYLSTSYVDHLHAEPSLPPTPVPSHPPSRPSSRRSTLKSTLAPAPSIIHISSVSASATSLLQQQGDSNTSRLPRADESTPLLCPPSTQHISHIVQPHAHVQTHGHAHPSRLPAIVTQDTAAVIPIEVLTNSPRIIKMRGCTCVVGHVCACPSSLDTPLPKDPSANDRSRSRSNLRAAVVAPVGAINLVEGSTSQVQREQDKPKVGRRRQIVGLLVLQLGIMIHSIVIGLTLSITTGADFTSLTTAVIFHQLFEGLSLGIRIAALPPKASDAVNDEEWIDSRGCKQGHRSRHGFFRNILAKLGGERGEGWLKGILAVLFAITTPAGMGLGMVAFEVGKKKEGIELARMYLTQGLMSAISAGMLIYASTVEMIAGDFVFGDVEGHSHHGHGHSHDLPSLSRDVEHVSRGRAGSTSYSRERQRTDDDIAENAETMVGDDEEAERGESHYHHDHRHHHGKIGKKILAVVSLLAGVGGMVLVGLGE